MLGLRITARAAGPLLAGRGGPSPASLAAHRRIAPRIQKPELLRRPPYREPAHFARNNRRALRRLRCDRDSPQNRDRRTQSAKLFPGCARSRAAPGDPALDKEVDEGV